MEKEVNFWLLHLVGVASGALQVIIFCAEWVLTLDSQAA